jgi:hypothetical protein
VAQRRERNPFGVRHLPVPRSQRLTFCFYLVLVLDSPPAPSSRNRFLDSIVGARARLGAFQNHTQSRSKLKKRPSSRSRPGIRSHGWSHRCGSWPPPKEGRSEREQRRRLGASASPHIARSLLLGSDQSLATTRPTRQEQPASSLPGNPSRRGRSPGDS